MRVLSKLSTLVLVLAGCPDPEITPEVPTYTITISNIGHGTVTADKETAHAGETIVLNYTENHSYRFVSYSIQTETGTNVAVSNHQFQMPAENVTVDALFWNKTGFVRVEGATVSGAVTGSAVFIEGRTVTIPTMFVCDHEVTQSEYETYCNYAEPLVDDYNNPVSRSTYGEGTNYPAFNVTWYDAIVYCNLRSIAENLTPVYKLGSDTATDVAWTSDNQETNGQAHTIKMLDPNGLGIHDMSGNVEEWCWDWYDDIETTTPATGSEEISLYFNKVRRGGSYHYSANHSQITRRNFYKPWALPDSTYDRGFRVVRTIFPN